MRTPALTAPTLANSAITDNPAALPSASQVPASDEQTDVIFGRNVKGPYLLTWKGIRADSERVVRDGVPLHRDSDYTLDPASGSLSFAEPLRADQIVRVTYRKDTPDAAPNPSAVILPLQWDLWQRGQNRLSLGMVYRSDPNAKATDPTAQTALQFVGGTHLSSTSELTSGLFLDLHGGDWLGRSGLRLAERTRLKRAEFGLTFSRAGALFAQGGATGLKAGNEIWEATGKFDPLKGLTLTTALRQMTELPAPGKAAGTPQQGTTTREFSQALDLALPKNGGTLQAARTETAITSPDGKGVLRTQDTLKLERTLVANTQATVSYEALNTAPTGDSKDGGSYEQKTSVGVTSRPSDRISLTGTFQNNLGTSGPQDTLGLRIETTPLARLRDLRIKAGVEDKFQPDGAWRTREALVELPTLPLASAKISGGVQQTSAPGKERFVGLVDASLRPFRYLDVSGGLRLRDGMLAAEAPDPDAVNTYNLKFALAPWKRFRLTGSMARNPENSDGTLRKVDSRALGLETELGILQLSGKVGYEEEYLEARKLNTLEVGLGFRLTPWDTLTTGYLTRAAFDKSLSGSESYLLNFTHRLGPTFDLSLGGQFTLYDTDGVIQPDKTDIKAEAKLSIRF
ncbi:MAG TPA: hypothetical protein VFB38_03845 [Chthonomonadaceae bacterium]|nr:hypothetical protein [Chthonomonadaceae bacterium]